MFSKSSMKDEDIKALINAVKREFQQEITTLNERILRLEQRNQHLEQQNLNLNTFIQHHFERLDRNIAENHSFILNQWNPFMQSTIEGVKNDLIETMNSNKKDDIELSKKVDTLAIQVSSLNKMVVDEDPLLEHVLVGTSINGKHIFVNKNEKIINIQDIFPKFETQTINSDSSIKILFLESLSRLKNFKNFYFCQLKNNKFNIMYKGSLLYKISMNNFHWDIRAIYSHNEKHNREIIEDYCKSININFIDTSS
jgi:hypothetical protein